MNLLTRILEQLGDHRDGVSRKNTSEFFDIERFNEIDRLGDSAGNDRSIYNTGSPTAAVRVKPGNVGNTI